MLSSCTNDAQNSSIGNLEGCFNNSTCFEYLDWFNSRFLTFSVILHSKSPSNNILSKEVLPVTHHEKRSTTQPYIAEIVLLKNLIIHLNDVIMFSPLSVGNIDRKKKN